MRYTIKLSFDGSKLSGWQKQANADSVQGELSKALSLLCGAAIEVTGAGRTDAGVNAVNYIAHFDAPEPVEDAELLCYKLNAILPKQMAVHAVFPAADDFHSRFSAVSRQYRYFVHRPKDPFIEKFSYRCRRALDVKAMNEAASLLLGEHDFSCFEKTGSDNATSVCTVFEARWDQYLPGHVSLMGYPCHEGDYLVFTIRANRFLRNMVRAVVGTLLEIGLGKKEPSWVGELLAGGTRSDAGQSVPGNALFLSDVEY